MENTKIQLAKAEDSKELLALYHTMLGGAAEWNENYPNQDTIDFDISRDALFVMRNEKNEIIAAISIDQDEDVEKLPCWSRELYPSGEVSRLVVRDDYQNHGISRIMMNHTFEVLKASGHKGVHILVIPSHVVAIQAYSHLGFKKVGECDLFEKHFTCFELAL